MESGIGRSCGKSAGRLADYELRFLVASLEDDVLLLWFVDVVHKHISPGYSDDR